jgi:FkbM family methyltransferase
MKSFVRSLLPVWLYRRLARLYAYLRAAPEGPRLIASLVFGKGIAVHHFKSLLHPFTFRLTDEDKHVVFGNLIRKEVLAGPLPVEACFIVDAGGYIGDSAALLLSRYPAATCLVLEPGVAHVLAAQNLAPYDGRAILRKAALMRENGSFRIDEADTGSRLVADPAGSTEVMTMADVLGLSPSGTIDILKIDIEGAEADLFSGPCPWLASVRCVTIELHGEVARRDVSRVLISAGFITSTHGCLTVAVKPDIIKE